MFKKVELSGDEITTLILATSRYLESAGEKLQGYPDEKLNPDELREISNQVYDIANLRELLFNARENKRKISFVMEEIDKNEDNLS